MGIYLKQVTNLDAEGRVVTNLDVPTASGDSATKGYVDDEIAVPSIADKALTPSATSGDDQPTSLTITATPARDSYVHVVVNGAGYELGDGVKTKDCYFSGDSGTTARDIVDVSVGDELYWNGTISGLDLAGTDRVDFHYLVNGTTPSSPIQRRLVMLDTRTFVSGTVTGTAGEVFTSEPSANAGKFVSVASVVPLGTVAIVFHVTMTISSSRLVELCFRRPGESDRHSFVSTNTAVSVNLREAQGDMAMVSLDSDRQFESYIVSSAGGAVTGFSHGLYVMGYVI